ncbi:MAG: hypothetical protein C5B44_00285 [Acidobacteria bacterium]|nr:MAG: hypothetical protein C5B44_00285 [Acidobacteriota bacterium]
MKRRLYITRLLIVLWCLVASSSVITAPVASSRAGYHEIAQYISRRVVALKGKVSGFESISPTKHIYLWKRPFKPIVNYDNGVTKWEPDADAEPPMKRAVYSKHGFTLVIWMVEGDLTWSPPKPPVKVAGYTVSAELAGPEASRIQPVIDQIVADAAKRFNR